MTVAEQKIRKLASKLDQEDMTVLGMLLQKVASDSAAAGAQAQATQEEALHKIAADLVSQGFSNEEIAAGWEKIAEHQKTAAECRGIAEDIMAMGTMLGKQASAVQMAHADELASYIGKKAAAVHIKALQNFVKRAQDESDEDMPPEKRKEHEGKESPEFEAGESEEENEDKKSDKKEGEAESEKEATNRKVNLLRAILEGTGLENAI